MKSIPLFFKIIFRHIALISLILSFAVVAKALTGPSVTLSVDNSSIVEAAGMSTITATLSVAWGSEVTVAIGSNASSTATGAGTDYTLSTTSIIITAGNTTGTAILTAIQDVSAEGNETVVIDITGVTNGTEDGTQQKTVTIIDDDASPTVTFTADAANTVVSFTDTSTGGPTSWLWDFGDGNTSTQQNPTHTYAAFGTYTICLTARNTRGSNTYCSQVTVSYPWAIFLPAMMNNVQQ